MPSEAPAVSCRGVSKVFDRRATAVRWRDGLGLAPRPKHPHHALDDIDLTILAGESVALIGPNGAGKSTLLKLVAGILHPTSGDLTVAGRVSAMIELGVGFHPELTGVENARCALVVQGLGLRQVDAALAPIAAFAGIGDAIDVPVKRYSAGMAARLAFAVATATPADVLVVDEILAVGDREFQERCFTRIAERRAAGTTLLFVTHEMPLVAIVCDRAVHIRGGRVVDDGPAAEVTERYLSRSTRAYRPDPAPAMRILATRTPAVVSPGARVAVEVDIEVREAVASPRVAVELSLPTLDPDIVTVTSVVDLAPLDPGRYTLAGTSSPLAVQGASYRLTTSLVDGWRHRVADRSAADMTVTGGRPGSLPSLMGRVHSTVEADAVDGAKGVPTGPAPITGPAVARLHGATKRYRRRGSKRDVAGAAFGRLGRDPVVALAGLDLTIAPGEALGLIGPNGAGKSTVIRLLAGLTRPDGGRVEVIGVPVTLLDTTAPFHPDMTGREGIDVAARVLGIGRDEQRRAMDEIVAFAGLGPALDTAVKHYSSGMRARLGFAVAIQAPGDVLLVDELLAVGDQDLRHDVLAAVGRRRAEGTSLVFVSHELALVEQVCDRVVWLRDGRAVDDGPADEVVARYGGTSWAAGTHDATAGVRLLPLEVPRRTIPTGATVGFTGVAVADVPLPTVRLEVAYRMPLRDRSTPVGSADRLARNLLVATIVPAGALSDPRAVRYTGTIDGNEWIGEMDLVVSAVDERDNEVLAETYRGVTVDRATPEGFPTLVLDIDWTVAAAPAEASS